MSDSIIVQNPCRYPIDSGRLIRASRAALNANLESQNGCLSIVLTDSKTIKAMNLRYAQVNAPTDVLSFPSDAAPQEPGRTGPYLGDIAIAHDYASTQATATATNVSDVICLLAIHGTLHLLGYDHDTRAARERMWEAQRQSLRSMSIDPSIVEIYGNSENDEAKSASGAK